MIIIIMIKVKKVGTQKVHTFNLSGTWAAGHSYTININMGTKVINAQ